MATDELTTPAGGVSVQKPRSNVYTVMLVLALLAIIIGCVFLYLEIQEYGGDIYGPAASLTTTTSTALSSWTGPAALVSHGLPVVVATDLSTTILPRA